MALTSPGVEVTITDESQYLPAPTNSVPLVLIATAQNKANATNTGVAPATTAANANKLFQVTSQRDLVNLYGNPFFYTTTNGTPIQGYELNEYGLLAAYSLLGLTNRCYVLRCDINLASLVGQTSRPTGAPADGSYWLDSTTSTWGIYAFNQTTGAFTLQTPIVITDPASLSNGVPLNSIGSIGNYAINAIQSTTSPTNPSGKTFFYKTTDNAWATLGGGTWRNDIPTVQGSISNPTIVTSSTFTINVSGLYTATLTVSGTTVNDVATAINDLDTPTVTARVVSGKLQILSNQVVSSGVPYIELTDGTNTPLAACGITAAGTIYNQPTVFYGTSAQMPLWTSSQTTPRPTGSVWIKIGTSGNGLYPSVSRYNAATASWVAKNITQATSDWAQIAAIDSTGGQAIPAGTIYGQYNFTGNLANAPYYLWERIATGPTVVTCENTSPVFTSGGDLYVAVSVPGSTSLSTGYTVTLSAGADAVDFVTAWSAAGIPNTLASVAADGAISLTHTQGGVIVLGDVASNVSSGVIAEMGLTIGTTTGVKYGPSHVYGWSNIAGTGGTGTGATFNIQAIYGVYFLDGTGIFAGGTGYSVGDVITIAGTSLNGTSANNLTLVVTQVSGVGSTISGMAFQSGTPISSFNTQLSNWVEFTYTSNEGAPVAIPTNNTNWFYSVTNQVDIMVQKGGAWVGYGTTAYDINGNPAASGGNTTDPNGPIIAATAPTTQSDGTALSYGDLWIDTSQLEVYPIIYRWEAVSGINQWVLIDTTDQVSQNGVLFQDARWGPNGSVNPVDDPIPTIKSMLTSNYVDLDAPVATLYPQGMMLFNTRRSGYNIKQFRTNYFTSAKYPNAGAWNPATPTNTSNLPQFSYTWVSVSGNNADGVAYMGRNAQRAMVVQALRASIDTNTDIRDEDNYFNLMAAPNYPELQPNMVVLNADRGETGFIIGDTPLGLADSATDIQAWATNAAGAVSTGEAGLVTRNTYLGLFYPSGIANDLSGNEVVVPASHMMLRTFLRNDTVAFPWLAPAGTRRGNIDNALNIGYLNRSTGEFVPIKTRLGIRDVLYINQINPMVFFTGVGLLNYGNKTSFNSQSALDRINVARLVNYVRRQLTIAARPFVFEPNDQLTRNEITGVIQTLLVDLVAKRGIYDYLVVCDDSNNTPARIDRSELWIDVAIEPVKAAEFIYIPVRVLNTGEISGNT
jgi:phage tail sheath protein FI